MISNKSRNNISVLEDSINLLQIGYFSAEKFDFKFHAALIYDAASIKKLAQMTKLNNPQALIMCAWITEVRIFIFYNTDHQNTTT